MIYICIPTHNEQQTVGVVLWKLRQVLTDFPRDYQLLVADDASTDKTPEVLEPYTRVLPLTVIRSERQQGTAASLEMLLREAVRRSEYPKRDVIVTLQADFSEEPDDMVPLVKRLEAGADVAVGNKVSSSKETRSRRFARSLARFFMRRQKWPEGVATPFDGFRAYRLHAVKRALEESGARRLICYDGWAGSAELLKAVLPHARRVDVVDIDDRPDRLQRPRREKPFAAAMQVRVMAAGTEPAGLLGVEELDRLAQTASRSRERAAITAESIKTDRGMTRTNGARTRTTGRREQGRARGQSNGASRARTGGSDGPRRDRAQAESRPARAEGGRPKAERPPREKPAEPRRRQPRSGTAAGAPAGGATAGGATGAGAADATDAAAVESPEELLAQNQAAAAGEKPKRKRRRRKRGGKGRSGASAAGEVGADGQETEQTGTAAESPGAAKEAPGAATEAPDPAAAGGETDGADSTDSAEGAAPKKRRRRGGRRGGRGRKRSRPEGESGEGGTAAAEGGTGAGAAAGAPAAADPPAGASPEPAGRSDND